MNDHYSPCVIEARLRPVPCSSNPSSSSSSNEVDSMDDNVKVRSTNKTRLISFRLFSKQKVRKDQTLISDPPLSSLVNDGPSTNAATNITFYEMSNHHMEPLDNR